LANKLHECGSFGVSSQEYLKYALGNRERWEGQGEEIVAELVRELAVVELVKKAELGNERAIAELVKEVELGNDLAISERREDRGEDTVADLVQDLVTA
jgi:hypothetical protein